MAYCVALSEDLVKHMHQRNFLVTLSVRVKGAGTVGDVEFSEGLHVEFRLRTGMY